MKFLVVDDDVEACGALRELFEGSGYAVEFEQDGDRGVRRTQTEPYDLLILDVAGVDGLEVLRHVRDQSQIPDLVLSAKAERADRVIGLRAGADDYLAKPFHADELLARIQAILRRTGTNSADTGSNPNRRIAAAAGFEGRVLSRQTAGSDGNGSGNPGVPDGLVRESCIARPPKP